MARIKNIIFVVILIALFVEVLIIFPEQLERIEADPPKAEATVSHNQSAEQLMRGVHVVESQKGSRDWELEAQAAEGYQAKATWEIEKVKVQLYSKEKTEFTVTGSKGTVDMKTKDLKIKGNVLVISANGYTFESTEVFYDFKKRLIRGNGPIVMKGPKDEQGEGILVRGSEMLVEVDTSKMTIKDNIHATKELSGAKKFSLTSDVATFSGRSREAEFAGHVVIDYNKTKIEAPSATFYYQKTRETLKNILLKGGVRVSDEDKYALSDEMNLDVEENKFTFNGRPRVYQNNDELSGEQIVFLDGGKKVKVENIRARVENKDRNKAKN